MLFIDPSPTCMGACAKTIPKPQPRCMQCASDPSPTCMGACAYTEVMMENESPVAFCMQCASGIPSQVNRPAGTVIEYSAQNFFRPLPNLHGCLRQILETWLCLEKHCRSPFCVVFNILLVVLLFRFIELHYGSVDYRNWRLISFLSF